MVNLDAGSTLKRLRNRYRLVVMNDDTYEEVVTFKLSRMSVYVMLSTVFVLLVGLTVALIVFTPLKYYIPGYDDPKAGREYRQLKYKADDMAKKMNDLENYNTALRNTLAGNTAIVLDTTQLKVPKQELSND
jgi:hypothetical protein